MFFSNANQCPKYISVINSIDEKSSQGGISFQLYADRIRTNAFGRNPNNASAIISVSVDGLIH